MPWQGDRDSDKLKPILEPRKPDREPDYPAIPDIEYDRGEQPRRGHFGFVYKATQARLNCPVAVKVLHRKSDEKELAEARTAAQLKHANIVTIHDTGVVDGRRYFIMEWMSGSLRDRLLEAKKSGRPLGTPLQIAALVEAIARGVALAQKRQPTAIVHRDLKPGNILVEADEGQDWFTEVKVADFGLAVPEDEIDSQSHGGGTPGYQSPEQLDSATWGPVDRFSDVYALGVILYQCLTGQIPKSVAAGSHPERPSKLNPQVPRDLEDICLACLSFCTLRDFLTLERRKPPRK